MASFAPLGSAIVFAEAHHERAVVIGVGQPRSESVVGVVQPGAENRRFVCFAHAASTWRCRSSCSRHARAIEGFTTQRSKPAPPMSSRVGSFSSKFFFGAGSDSDVRARTPGRAPARRDALSARGLLFFKTFGPARSVDARRCSISSNQQLTIPNDPSHCPSATRRHDTRCGSTPKTRHRVRNEVKERPCA